MVRIRVSQNEMLKLVTEYTLVGDSTPELLDHIYQYGFIFNEFALIWENTYTYKVRIEGLLEDQVIHIKKIVKTSAGTINHTNIDFTLPDFLNNMATYLKEAKNMKDISGISKKMIDDTWSADYIPVISFMQYALDKALNKEIIQKEKTDKIYKKSSRKSKSKPKMEYSLSEVVTHYASHVNHTKHEMKCRLWPVTGHVRHLPNGKTTWIAPHPKGPDRHLKTVNKDYRL